MFNTPEASRNCSSPAGVAADDSEVRPHPTPSTSRTSALRPAPRPLPVELPEPPPLVRPPALPLASPHIEDLLVAVSRIDGRGRIRVEDAEALGWSPSLHLAVTVANKAAVLVPSPDGERTVTLGADLRITLPHATWFALGVTTGSRVAVTADLDRGELHVCAAAALARAAQRAS